VEIQGAVAESEHREEGDVPDGDGPHPQHWSPHTYLSKGEDSTERGGGAGKARQGRARKGSIQCMARRFSAKAVSPQKLFLGRNSFSRSSFYRRRVGREAAYWGTLVDIKDFHLSRASERLPMRFPTINPYMNFNP
jgi:hypothetical protein